MRSGICPKCSQPTVHTERSRIPAGEGALHIIKHQTRFTFSYLDLDMQDYVCVTCGHFEQYIASPEALTTVAQNWQRVMPSQRPM